jgi:hypothetical protein
MNTKEHRSPFSYLCSSVFICGSKRSLKSSRSDLSQSSRERQDFGRITAVCGKQNDEYSSLLNGARKPIHLPASPVIHASPA